VVAQEVGQVTKGGAAGGAPRRVVLDTNVLLSALVFAKGPTARLRQAWLSGRIIPLASTASVQELMRVLAYPKFKLDAAACEELLADYLPWTQVVRVPDPPPSVPDCRDKDDLPFLYLAAAGRAHNLVTGDADLLALADTRPALRYAIVTPSAFLNSLDAGSSPA
jgi:putative PIN family toxin of toxin-antitoxin system